MLCTDSLQAGAPPARRLDKTTLVSFEQSLPAETMGIQIQSGQGVIFRMVFAIQRRRIASQHQCGGFDKKLDVLYRARKTGSRETESRETERRRNRL